MTDAEWKEVGSRLRSAREYLSLSQEAAANETGILRSAISDIERGNRRVDSLELRRLARLYQRPVGYFLGDDAGDQSSPAVRAVARALTDLTEDDRNEVLRFAEFLRHSAESNSKRRRPN
jgi:transcriptional regulator with XRE-family HTH domain